MKRTEEFRPVNVDKADRFLGCLLGGAVGDALGYPVEFIKEESIWRKYGENGIQTLDQAGNPAVITDDTQMTLFTANALLYGMTRTGVAVDLRDLWIAYGEWLDTQGDGACMEKNGFAKMWLHGVGSLHERRAPGLTCLQAIRDGCGTIEEPVNTSKGCGGVMRVAPIGLVSSVKNAADRPARLAAEAAALTHGHPMGYLSAAVLAQIVHDIVYDREIDPIFWKDEEEMLLGHIMLRAAERVAEEFPDTPAAEEIVDVIREIICRDYTDKSDLDCIHRLGEGWIGEEALYIAVYCAFRHQNDFAAAIRASVNHKGDSDSTGAICGNILGAWLGAEKVEEAFDLEKLEMRGLIEAIAWDLFHASEHGIPDTSNWRCKYVYGRGDVPLPKERLERNGFVVKVRDADPKHLDEDVQVCAVNEALMPMGKYSVGLQDRQGPKLRKYLRQHAPLAAGEAVALEPQNKLALRCVVYASVPAYSGENADELEQLYFHCLQQLREHSHKGARSVSLPLFGVEDGSWPAEISVECAWRAILKFVGNSWRNMPSFVNGEILEIVLKVPDEYMPLARSYTRRPSAVFFTGPLSWGLRGDPFLWDELMHHFDRPQWMEDGKCEISIEGFVDAVCRFYEEVAGKKLTKQSQVMVPRYNFGGMSGGVLSGEFWVEKGLPLLCENFCSMYPGSSGKEFVRVEKKSPFGKTVWNLPKEAVLALEKIR